MILQVPYITHSCPIQRSKVPKQFFFRSVNKKVKMEHHSDFNKAHLKPYERPLISEWLISVDGLMKILLMTEVWYIS